MKALYINNGKISFRSNYPNPHAKVNEALIKVRLAGVCSTDLELVKGYAGFKGVPGHEFVGEVVKVRSMKHKSLIGSRVVSNINLGCMVCEYCKKGIIEHCLNGRALGILEKDGAFAEYVTLPVNNLYVLPKSVSDRQAVFVEPLAAAVRIPDQIHISPAKKVAILGPGRLGILISQVLAMTGCGLTVVGRSRGSLELPRKLGFETGFAKDFGDKSFDVVVETTGSEDGFGQALRLIKPLGSIVMKSTYKGDLTTQISKVVVDEIKIIGSRCGPFLPAIDLLAKKRVETESLIEKIYPLSKGVQAFGYATKPGVRKVLLRP